MATSRRARTGVDVQSQSIHPAVPGVPAIGAVLIAIAFMLVGFLIDAATGSDLTRVFEVFFIGGCVAAACAVRYRALFTAMVQPPLLLFIAVPLAYQFFTEGGSTSVKNIALNVAIPLVNRFPMMLMATTAAVAVGALRVYLAHRHRDPSDRRADSRRPVVGRRPRGRTTERGDRHRAGRLAGRRDRTEHGEPAYPGTPPAEQWPEPGRSRRTDRTPPRSESRVARPVGTRDLRTSETGARSASRTSRSERASRSERTSFPPESPTRAAAAPRRPDHFPGAAPAYRNPAPAARNPTPGRHARDERSGEPIGEYAVPLVERRTSHARYPDY